MEDFSAGACVATPSLHGIDLVDLPHVVPRAIPMSDLGRPKIGKFSCGTSFSIYLASALKSGHRRLLRAAQFALLLCASRW